MDSKRPARRHFLKSGAALAGGFTLGGAAPAFGQAPPPSPPMIKGDKDQIPYGDRSKFVTSVRIAHGGRPSPDAFGLYFHIATPLQDSVGVITPSSLHFVGTTRGAYIPEIDPREHRLLIHGMVDRPLTFTMEDLKRLPSVTRLHFIECAGNRASRKAKTVQESHGMTSCAEWTGVPLSLLLKECGLKGGATWFVAEGSEEVKGASSMPIAKAMDDCLLAYGMNGEDLRPQQGFPLRLMVPGFEGIFHTKYLRRIKIVDRYYMNYNDFGHLDRDPKVAALEYQIGPKSVITFPSGGHQLAGRGFYEIRGLAWSGGGAIRKGGSVHRRRQALEPCRDQGNGAAHGACAIHVTVELGRTRDRASFALHGRDRSGSTVAGSDRQRTGRRALTPTFSVPGLDNTIQPWRIARTGASTMGMLRVLRPFALLMGVCCAGAVAYVWSGTHADRRGDPRVGYLHRSHRRGASAGARNDEGGRPGLSREVRRMPRGDGDRGQGAHHEKQGRPGCRALGIGDESWRFARRSRRRSGITSIAPCLSIVRERSRPTRCTR